MFSYDFTKHKIQIAITFIKYVYIKEECKAITESGNFVKVITTPATFNAVDLLNGKL